MGGSSYVKYCFFRFTCIEPFCNFLCRLATIKDTVVIRSIKQKGSCHRQHSFFDNPGLTAALYIQTFWPTWKG